jgi:FixJ family two-component response regulator
MNNLGACADCGKPCHGTRCREHHTAYLKRLALEETAERDAALLALVDQKLSNRSIAVRLNISPVRVGQKLVEARRRQKERDTVTS